MPDGPRRGPAAGARRPCRRCCDGLGGGIETLPAVRGAEGIRPRHVLVLGGHPPGRARATSAAGWSCSTSCSAVLAGGADAHHRRRLAGPVGGLVPGVKCVESRPGPAAAPRDPPARPVPLPGRGQPRAASRSSTPASRGSRRTSSAEVVDQVNASSKAYLFTLRHMAQLALDAKDAIERRDPGALGDVLALSWAANQRVHPSTTNEEVEEILAATRAHFRGVKLLGAGGGGYALFLCGGPAAGGGGARRAAPPLRERAGAAGRLLVEHVRAGGFGLVIRFVAGAAGARQEDPDGFRFREGPAPQDRPAHEARRAEEPPGEGRQRRLRPLGEPGPHRRATRRSSGGTTSTRGRNPFLHGAAGRELRLQRRAPSSGTARSCLVARVEGDDRKSFFAVAESDNGVDDFRFWDQPDRACRRPTTPTPTSTTCASPRTRTAGSTASSARSGRTRRPPRATPPRRSPRPGSRAPRTS